MTMTARIDEFIAAIKGLSDEDSGSSPLIGLALFMHRLWKLRPEGRVDLERGDGRADLPAVSMLD
jgi:hypothetical protein